MVLCEVDMGYRDSWLGDYWKDGARSAIWIVLGLVVYDYSWSRRRWYGRHLSWVLLTVAITTGRTQHRFPAPRPNGT